MFPLKVFIPFAFLNHYILYFTVQLFLGVKTPILSFYSLIGVATILGFMLIMRIFDELKDTEIDKKLFSNRPFPRGAVKKSDLLILLFSIFFIIVILNSFRNYTLPFFLVCLFYGYLTYKWFFLKKIISKYLLLALITHQPLTYLINIYVASTAMVQVKNVMWNSAILWATFVFFIPVLGWEISRKIKAKGTENEYVTYSKIFGCKSATILSLIIHLGFSISLIFLGFTLSFHPLHLVFQLLIIAYVLFIYLRFLVSPIEKYNKIKKTSELQSGIVTLIYLVFLIKQTGVEFIWF
jgi:4-hydroxybenzoate polyprenyltransferase